MIPALALGIPGDSITAIILGASMIYGLRPGPLMFGGSERRTGPGTFAIGIFPQLMLIPIGLLAIRAFGKVFKLPTALSCRYLGILDRGFLCPELQHVRCWAMFLFGMLGFYMERNGIPVTPLVLAIILGPLIERNLRLGLMQTGGNLVFLHSANLHHSHSGHHPVPLMEQVRRPDVPDSGTGGGSAP